MTAEVMFGGPEEPYEVVSVKQDEGYADAHCIQVRLGKWYLKRSWHSSEKHPDSMERNLQILLHDLLYYTSKHLDLSPLNEIQEALDKKAFPDD